MFKPLMKFSPDPAGGGGTPDFTEEQEKVIQARIDAELEKVPKLTLSSATKFIENAEGMVFLSQKAFDDKVGGIVERVQKERIDNPTDLESRLIKFKGDMAGEALTPVDEVIKSLTGIEKNAGEKTKDFAKRALPSLKTAEGGEIDITEFNAIKTSNEKLKQQLEEKNNEFTKLTNDIVGREKKDILSKGIFGAGAKFTKEEEALMMPGLESKINEHFDFVKDDKGYKAVNKQNQAMETDAEGNRKDPIQVVSDFVKTIPGLKFETNGARSGAGLPGSGGQSKEQQEEAEKKWQEQVAEKGLLGHEKEAMLMRKNAGLPVSAQAVKIWPELAN